MAKGSLLEEYLWCKWANGRNGQNPWQVPTFGASFASLPSQLCLDFACFLSLLLDSRADRIKRTNLLQKELEKFPVFASLRGFRFDQTRHPLFDGFFEWLYAQPEPGNVLALPERYQNPNMQEIGVPPNKLYADDARNPLALMQLLKIYETMQDRRYGTEPVKGFHVACRVSPVYSLLTRPSNVSRLPLQVSVWSDPQTVVNGWAESKNSSIVLEVPQAETGIYSGDIGEVIREWEKRGDPFWDILLAELWNRFGFEYENERMDILGPDYGILDPRYELLHEDS